VLKGIHPALTPDLLWTLQAMGHGDVLAIADRNYPAHGVHTRVHHLPGLDTVEAATAICTLLPIDTFVPVPAHRMVPDDWSDDQLKGALADVDEPLGFASHDALASVLRAAEGRAVPIGPVRRTPFYRQAREAFAVVTTTDDRPYSCFLLTKGVV